MRVHNESIPDSIWRSYWIVVSFLFVFCSHVGKELTLYRFLDFTSVCFFYAIFEILLEESRFGGSRNRRHSHCLPSVGNESYATGVSSQRWFQRSGNWNDRTAVTARAALDRTEKKKASSGVRSFGVTVKYLCVSRLADRKALCSLSPQPAAVVMGVTHQAP